MQRLLFECLPQANLAAKQYFDAARQTVGTLVGQAGADAGLSTPGSRPLEAHDQAQRAVHGLAWVSTYVNALREIEHWISRLRDQNKLGQTDQLIAAIGSSEYLAQLCTALPMTQLEMLRPTDMGCEDAAAVLAANVSVRELV